MKARLLIVALPGLLGGGEARATLPGNESTASGCLGSSRATWRMALRNNSLLFSRRGDF